MEDAYAYVKVKLYLKEGQTEDSIHEIIQDMDYRFIHTDIVDHEIIDIVDIQCPKKNKSPETVDPFDSINI